MDLLEGRAIKNKKTGIITKLEIEKLSNIFT